MNSILEKIVIYILCVSVYFMFSMGLMMVVPVIVAITFVALNTYFESKVFRLCAALLYTVLSVFLPPYMFFIPVIYYELFVSYSPWLMLLALIPVAVHFPATPPVVSILIVLFMGLAYFIKLRTATLIRLKNQYTQLRDDAKGLTLSLEKKNRELMDKHDYEVNLATLNERNRIAREIHDNVGHLLSSSILQIGALLTISKEPTVKDGLITIKNTLSLGMDSIRNSVHNLYDESINLEKEVTRVIDDFHFCPVNFEYDMTEHIEKRYKYCFIAILKEALANIIKHSNATQVTVIFREHPGLYQLVIQDNGLPIKIDPEKGIGLINMEDRVKSLNGNIHISCEKGFRIFISIPKEIL